jgi:site-specific DNA-adenine methylase
MPNRKETKLFSYYGSKSKIVHLYPKPLHSRIIEPFAGSARYALHYWEHDVLLVDKYDVVIRIWKWLQQCSPQDILHLPLLRRGMDLRKLSLSDEEKLFLSFLVNVGSKCPTWKVSPFAASQFEVSGLRIYQKAAGHLHKIKHWEIKCGDYKDIPNQVSTWFIDPPYMIGGQYYRYGSTKIDYEQLGVWCKSRKGQVIVCENDRANWLDFKPVCRNNGANNKGYTESIWSNQKTVYDHVQQLMFT